MFVDETATLKQVPDAMAALESELTVLEQNLSGLGGDLVDVTRPANTAPATTYTDSMPDRVTLAKRIRMNVATVARLTAIVTDVRQRLEL